jgi:nitrogen fixation NifU-like protein
VSQQNQLYNDALVALARANHRAGRLPEPHASVTRDNPLCGDRVTLDVKLAGGRVADLAQKTRGCLLTQAAASLIGNHAGALDRDEAERVAAEVERLLRGEAVATPSWPELAMFAPVAAVRSRHECVLLPFQALSEVLERADADPPGGEGS